MEGWRDGGIEGRMEEDIEGRTQGWREGMMDRGRERWREGGIEGRTEGRRESLLLCPPSLAPLYSLPPTACNPFGDFINGLKSPGSPLLSPVSSRTQEAGPKCVTAASEQAGGGFLGHPHPGTPAALSQGGAHQWHQHPSADPLCPESSRD